MKRRQRDEWWNLFHKKLDLLLLKKWSNYCWNYSEPVCISTFHMEHRSSSQPIWKILNYSQYSIWIISQRGCCKWQCGSSEVMDLSYTTTWNSSVLARIFGRQDAFLTAVCEAKGGARYHRIVIWKSLECNICLEIAFRGCTFILSCQKWRCYRGEETLKQSSSLLCASLYLVAAVHNT